MGTRANDTLREIELIRHRLDGTLRELETRLPSASSVGKRVAAAAAGSGAAGIVMKMAVKRMRKGGRKKAARAAARVVTTPVVVRVLPGGAIPAAIVIAGVWAAVRILEARARADGQMPEAERRLRSVSALGR